MENRKRKILSAFKFFSFILTSLLLMSFGVYAQSSKYEQKIRWQADKNAIEYKVEVKGGGMSKSLSFETEENFVNLSLPSGIYQYRVYAYDFLGRESSVSDWTEFEITKAVAPEIKKTSEKVIAPDTKNSKVQISVDIASLEQDSKVELINTETDEKVSGLLKVEKTTEGVVASRAEFPKVKQGEWKLKVTNPSGLSSESQTVTVVDQAVEDARIKAEEEERKKAEAAALAKAQAEEEERKKAEAAALAKAQAEEEERKKAEAAAMAKAQAEEEERKKAEAKERRKNRKILGAEAFADYGIILAPVKNDFINDQGILQMAMVRFDFLPVKINRDRAGIEMDVKVSQSEAKLEDYKLQQPFCIFDLNAVYQKSLLKDSVYLYIRFGADVAVIERKISFNESFAGNDFKTALGYTGVQAGLSVNVAPVKNLILETGCDINHIFMGDIYADLLVPYFGVGYRW